MCDFDHLFHLDRDWMWRWHRVNIAGQMVSKSRPFFNLKDAQADYDDVHGYPMPLAA